MKKLFCYSSKVDIRKTESLISTSTKNIHPKKKLIFISYHQKTAVNRRFFDDKKICQNLLLKLFFALCCGNVELILRNVVGFERQDVLN